MQVGDRTWRAIVPPEGVVYYVPAEALRLEGGRRLAAARAGLEREQEPLGVSEPVIADDLTAVGPRRPRGGCRRAAKPGAGGRGGAPGRAAATDRELATVVDPREVPGAVAAGRRRRTQLSTFRGTWTRSPGSRRRRKSSRTVAELLSKPGLSGEPEHDRMNPICSPVASTAFRRSGNAAAFVEADPRKESVCVDR